MAVRFLPRGARCTAKRSVVALMGAVLPLGVLGGGIAAANPSSTVTVVVDASAPGKVIPKDFLGMSFEADQMHRTWTDPERGNVATLLRNLGVGNLRFSANQVDNTAWMPDPSKPTPSWARNGQRVVPADLSRVGRLAKATGWSVDLGVNLGHFDPAAAADQAAAAQKRIGDSLRSIQIGNEPNAYVLNLAQGNRRIYTPATYVRDVRIYRTAINAAAPTVPVEGPDAAGGSIGVASTDAGAWSQIVEPWLNAYTGSFAAQSRYLTQHYYPYVNVTRVGVPASVASAAGALPTVDGLLTPQTRAKQEKFLRQFAAVAHRAGLLPVMSETNSVAKEGREGVTDSFGAALWTVDYLMSAARAGMVGINLHNQVDDCQSYPLFCFPNTAAKRLDTARVNPNYYATLMVSKMVGGRLLPTSTTGRGQVTASAVRMPSGQIRVILTSPDQRFRGTVSVKVVGADGSATVQRMTAPSIYATRGTRFAGASVSADGTFAEQASESVNRRGSAFGVAFTRPEAALLTVG